MMQYSNGWMREIPLKCLILSITILFLFTANNTSNAMESQNKTLSEVSSYNFTEGFYNIVQYGENATANLRTLFETEIPYLNISYQAPSDGYLEIYLQPLTGPVPYIELDKYWEIKSLTYSKTLDQNEVASFFITPPMIFTSSNYSMVVGGGITLWEMYKWPNLSGLINYSFTSADEISFDLLWYPIYPRQGEEISLFTESNVKILNVTWTISGEDIDWENTTDVLEIDSLDEGNYTISVIGYDKFNGSHSAQAQISVKPPVYEAKFLDINLFSVDFPGAVNLGDSIPLTATIDYSLSDPTEIKIVLEDPQDGEKYKEIDTSLSGNGSIQIASNLEAVESGVMSINLRLFYSKGDEWVELVEASRLVSITVNEVVEPQTLPGFNLVSISVGLILLLTVNFLRSRK